MAFAPELQMSVVLLTRRMTSGHRPNEQRSRSDRLKTGPYTGDNAYKTPIKINGKKYYRKTVKVTSDRPPTRYSDVLARWAKDGNASLEAAMGPSRARWFKAQYDRMNADPQQILQAMLTGKPGEQKWIPVEKLNAKFFDLTFKAK